MHGPWYTLETAKEKLGLNQEELFYHIEKYNIYPVIFTKERPFLLFDKGHRKRWIGVGTCLYRGPLLLLGDPIITLLDEGELRLGQGMVRIQEPDSVKNFCTDYPFKSSLPLGPIYEWQKPNFDGEEIEWLYATPMPEEQKTTLAALNELSNILFGKESSAEETTQPQIEMILNFQTNSLFKIEDIRFAASQIERLLSTLSPAKKNNEKPETKTNTPPRLKGKRISQLHQLIFSALVDNTSASAKELWDLIQQDSESDTPQYDPDGIISIMDAVCIEWCSRNRKNLSMKWASFETLLPKLRRQLPA